MVLKICMFVYNNCKRDARVLKEAKTLTNAGYDVRIIAVLDKETEPYEERDGFKILRVIKDPLHYRILRGVKNFNVRRIILPPYQVVKKAIHFIQNIITELISQRKRFEAEAPSDLNEGFIARLKQAFQGLEESIKRQGVHNYVAETFKHRRLRSSISGCILLFMYYSYNFVRKVTYWGIKRPFRFVRRYARKGVYWGIKRPLFVFHRPLSFKDFYNRSFEIVKKDPANVYHAHDLNTLPVAYWAARSLGGKVIYDSHELYTETSSLSRIERKISKIIERRLIRRVDKVITVNESIAAELSKRYKVSPPVIVMNCPIFNNHTYKQKANLLHEKLGLDEKVSIILYQGGYSPHRGLRNLILSAHYLCEGIIVLMGWGRLEQELRDLVAVERLNDKVRFADPVSQDELLDYTRSASLGVIPYQFVGLNNYYTTPNKLFEYIVAGLPVVGSNFPELKRIIEGYNIGATFNPEDSKDIARAIEYVLSDPKRYATFKENSKLAAKIFNWQNEEKKLLQIYNELREDLS